MMFHNFTRFVNSSILATCYYILCTTIAIDLIIYIYDIEWHVLYVPFFSVAHEQLNGNLILEKYRIRKYQKNLEYMYYSILHIFICDIFFRIWSQIILCNAIDAGVSDMWWFIHAGELFNLIMNYLIIYSSET